MANFGGESFAALGQYAKAGEMAATLALEQALESGAAGRIPISGAAVQMGEDGALTTVTVGCNGRIPSDAGAGYPSDHGETGAIRLIHDFSSIEWSHTVFATSLSPCVMCTRTLIHLHSLGLTRIVIVESQSFLGRKDLLRDLPGMQLIELANADAVRMMGRFARRYPWDWAADIGEIPPSSCKAADATMCTAAWALLDERGHGTAVVAPDGSIVATASDERSSHGGNPVESSTMRAIGLSGSAINLREHTLVLRTKADTTEVNLDSFGSSSLGACELFRPLALIFDVDVEASLEAALSAAGITVHTAPAQSPRKRTRK